MDKMKQIALALGLPADATEAQILEASQRSADELTLAREAAKTHAAQLATIEAERLAREAVAREAAVGAAILKLVTAGKIQPGGPAEAALRRLGASSTEVFDAHVTELAGAPSVTPVGAKLPGATVDPGGERLADGKAFIGTTPGLTTWLRNAGITDEEFETHGAQARGVVEHYRTQR